MDGQTKIDQGFFMLQTKEDVLDDDAYSTTPTRAPLGDTTVTRPLRPSATPPGPPPRRPAGRR